MGTVTFVLSGADDGDYISVGIPPKWGGGMDEAYTIVVEGDDDVSEYVMDGHDEGDLLMNTFTSVSVVSAFGTKVVYDPRANVAASTFNYCATAPLVLEADDDIFNVDSRGLGARNCLNGAIVLQHHRHCLIIPHPGRVNGNNTLGVRKIAPAAFSLLDPLGLDNLIDAR